MFVYISSHGGCLQMYCQLSLMITLSFSWVHFGYNTCLQSCYKLITMITFYYITGLWGCLQTGCPGRRSWQSSLPLRHHQQHRSACDPQTGQRFWGQLKGKWRSLFLKVELGHRWNILFYVTVKWRILTLKYFILRCYLVLLCTLASNHTSLDSAVIVIHVTKIFFIIASKEPFVPWKSDWIMNPLNHTKHSIVLWYCYHIA